MKKGIAIVIVVLAIVIAGIYLSKNDSNPVEKNDFAFIPGATELRNNMQKAGLETLSAEGTVLHIHQHLDLTVNGKNIDVPADIGVATTFISPIHTHDDSGIIHVESPVQKDFKLSQFFDEWGVRFDDSCIGNYCADDSHKLIVAVNGNQINNVRDYVLKAHDEIHVWYGSKDENPQLIKEFKFTGDL